MELRGVNISNGVNIKAYDPPSLATSLGVMTDALITNINSLKNPAFYPYDLDGDEFYIAQGGPAPQNYSMYGGLSGGNYTAPALISGQNLTGEFSISPSCSYTDTGTNKVIDTNFNYRSLGYASNRIPLTLLGTRVGTGYPIGFQKAGFVISTTGQVRTNGYIYENQVINGFTVYASYQQTYSTNVPQGSINPCNLYILLGHPSWNSVFGTVTRIARTDTLQGSSLFTSGPNVQNVLAITSLLSRANIQFVGIVETAWMETIVQTYITVIKNALGL